MLPTMEFMIAFIKFFIVLVIAKPYQTRCDAIDAIAREYVPRYQDIETAEDYQLFVEDIAGELDQRCPFEDKKRQA